MLAHSLSHARLSSLAAALDGAEQALELASGLASQAPDGGGADGDAGPAAPAAPAAAADCRRVLLYAHMLAALLPLLGQAWARGLPRPLHGGGGGVWLLCITTLLLLVWAAAGFVAGG